MQSKGCHHKRSPLVLTLLPFSVTRVVIKLLLDKEHKNNSNHCTVKAIQLHLVDQICICLEFSACQTAISNKRLGFSSLAESVGVQESSDFFTSKTKLRLTQFYAGALSLRLTVVVPIFSWNHFIQSGGKKMCI